MSDKRYRVIKSWKDDNLIRHRVYYTGDDSDPHDVEYSAVVAGLSWPVDMSPGYYVIMGQEVEPEDFRAVMKYQPLGLKFLCEFESPSFSTLIERLTDDVKMMMCESVFCDMESGWEGFAEAVWSVASRCSGNIALVQAPFTSNFQFGAQKLAERIEKSAIDVPEDSILRTQIERMEVKDLKEKPEVYYYAVNALRYLVCGIEKYSMGPIPPGVMASIMRAKGKRPGGFMAS